jgi:hypothetical protein
VRLPVAITELLQHGEGPLAEGEDLLMVAELAVKPADDSEGMALPGSMAECPG